MAQKLGEISKPKVSDYAEKRKLFCLPLLPDIKGMEMPDKLKTGFEQFWNQSELFSGIELGSAITCLRFG